MTPESLPIDLAQMVPQLLRMARELTWNTISDNCRFILTEIPNTPLDFHALRTYYKRQNEAKRPVFLESLVPVLQQLYPNLHDINLYIYKSTPQLTVIDIRYYPRTSLTEAYRQQVAANPPMLHAKVAHPPWLALATKTTKFDINWERRLVWARWKMFWLWYVPGK